MLLPQSPILHNRTVSFHLVIMVMVMQRRMMVMVLKMIQRMMMMVMVEMIMMMGDLLL